MHPSDEHSQKVIRALQTADLDALIPLMSFAWPARTVPAAQVHSMLQHIFTQAQQDGLNLLHPPANFHGWLLEQASKNVNAAPAKPNTVRLRLSLLSTLYTALQDQGLMLVNPLRGLQRPPNERSGAPLLPRAKLERLHLQAGADHVLYAALVLIDEHAYRARDLLALAFSGSRSQRRRCTRWWTTRCATKAAQPRTSRKLDWSGN